jgi:hypothetical protein
MNDGDLAPQDRNAIAPEATLWPAKEDIMARAQSKSKSTTDHEEIRRWAEAHDGHPAAVARTGKGSDPGILRIDFPGFSGAGSLRPISWDQFFKSFDANELALVYRDQDRFNKLVSRESVETRRARKPARRRVSARQQPPRRRAATQKRGAVRRTGAASSQGRSAKAKRSQTRARRPSRR